MNLDQQEIQGAQVHLEVKKQEEYKVVRRLPVKKGAILYGLNTKNGQLSRIEIKKKLEVKFNREDASIYRAVFCEDTYYLWAINDKNATRKAGDYIKKLNSAVEIEEKAIKDVDLSISEDNERMLETIEMAKENVNARMGIPESKLGSAVDSAMDSVKKPDVVIGDEVNKEVDDIITKHYENPPAFNDYTRADAERYKNKDV